MRLFKGEISSGKPREMGKRLRAKASSGKLTSALLRHQALEKKTKDKSEKTARALAQKKDLPKIRKNQEENLSNRKRFIPFEKDNYVLLVGEGDMSFALSVLNEGYVKPSRLIITSYDNSANELKLKYPTTFEKNYHDIVQIHRARVLFKVDATNILKSLRLTPKTLFKILGIPKLDVIMFNFPHTGKGIKDQDRNIRDHQILVLGYMKSSMELFKLFSDVFNNTDSGLNLATDSIEVPSRIVLSVFEGEPYNSWNIKSLAKTLGLKVERSGSFQWDLYPGYHHRRTNSEQQTTKKALERKARSYVFEKFIKEKHSTSKNSRDSESE